MSNSLWLQGLQHARLPCPSLSSGVCSNSCPLNWLCHPTISSSVVPFFSCPQFFPASGSFPWVCSSYQVTKVLKLQFQHQSFQWIFRVDFLYNWLVWSPCCPSDSQESSPVPQFNCINSWHSAFFIVPTLISLLDYWKNHSFDCTDLCQQNRKWIQSLTYICITFFEILPLYHFDPDLRPSFWSSF